MSPDSRALVLTYHSISEGPGPLRVSPRAFEEQLERLARAGFEAVPLASVVDDLEAARPFGGRRFALTFDDGYRDFADAALPILERRGLPATLFVTAARDRERLPGGLPQPLLPLDALAGLAIRGVEIGAHSVAHGDLTALTADALERELAGCARALAECLGRPVAHFAYPYGCYDARVRTAAARHFRSACTTQLARVEQGGDRFAIPRVDACYLRSPILRLLLGSGRLEPYLRVRRRLRRLRGSEPAPGGATFAAGRCDTIPAGARVVPSPRGRASRLAVREVVPCR